MLEKLFIKLEKITPARHRWIFSHDGVRRYFKNTGWMFSGQIVYLFLSFFIGAWIARYLGPENYGVVSSGNRRSAKKRVNRKARTS